MAVQIYYVVNDGFDRWGVRRNQDQVSAWCKDRDDAVMTARRYAARDHRNGHDAQVQIQTELGFELDWRFGAPIEPGAPKPPQA
jgi:hypothetical protein